MMKKYYLQIGDSNVITDAIEYPYGDYVEFETDKPLPVGVNGGWFKLINGVLVEDVEKNPNTIENRIQEAIDEFTLSLIDGGIL